MSFEVFSRPPAYSRLLSKSTLAALAAVSLVALSACSMFDSGNGDNGDEAEAKYIERPVEQIYADAWKKIRSHSWEDAAKQFDEVERQHPYSVWARRAMLMSAFCYYQANKYTEAIAAADQYIELHPGSQEVAYAFYLKAMSLYEQIVDVGRDQTNTEQALTALQDVVQRFPNTEYARDALLKIDLTQDHLAGKEMEVGRYYLHHGDYIGAINRFRVVVERYQRTPQIAEALERLDRSLLRDGRVRRSKNRGGGAGRELSRKSLVPGFLRASPRAQHEAGGQSGILDQQVLQVSCLRS